MTREGFADALLAALLVVLILFGVFILGAVSAARPTRCECACLSAPWALFER